MEVSRTRNLFHYVLPAVIGQACFFLFTIVDGIFVGNGVGENALGAINIVMPFVMVVNALFMMVAVGGVTVTAIRLGRGDQRGANDAFMHTFAAMLALAVLLAVIGITLTRPIGFLLGANETYIGYVSDYW